MYPKTSNELQGEEGHVDVQNLNPVGLESEGQGNSCQAQNQLQRVSPEPTTHADVIKKYRQLTQSRAARVVGETYRNLKKQTPDWQQCYQLTKRNKTWGRKTISSRQSYYEAWPAPIQPFRISPHLVYNTTCIPCLLVAREMILVNAARH